MKNQNHSILIVTPSFDGGGAEKIAVNLANQFSVEGIDVTLLVVRPEGPYREQVNELVKIVDLNCISSVQSLFRVFFAIKKFKPTNILSVIRDTNIFVGLSRIFLDVKCVVYREANTLDHIYGSVWYKRWVWYSLMRISYARANSLIANSKGTCEHLLESKIVNRKKLSIIDNPVLPIDVDRLLSSKIEDEWLLDPNIKVVLNVGRLHPAKNQRLLIRAFSEVLKKRPDVRLIILGEGSEEDNLVHAAKEEGVLDYFKIIQFQSNPFPYYKNADVFVLSSNYEGFGNVLVEALSSGNPVISTNCPGGPKSILADGKFGVLVEPGNSREMADAIIDVLEGRITFDKFSLIMRSREYRVDTISKKYWSLFEK